MPLMRGFFSFIHSFIYFFIFLFINQLISSAGCPDLLHPFSIDIFEDYIYGVTYINNIVFRVNKFGKGKMENLTTGINHASDIVLHHRYKQPESESNDRRAQMGEFTS